MTTITVEVPEEKKEQLQTILDEMGLSYQSDEVEKKIPLSQKQRLLEIYRNRKSRPGWSKELEKLRKEFREDFEL